MISIIITSFKEPHTIGKAIESFLNQDIKENYELIVSAPDKETQEIVKKFSKKNKQVKLFKDPGKGKSFALNLLLPKIKGRILILTDGDVYVSKNSINEILKVFKNKNVGCVSGRPVSIEDKKKMLGYWSHMLCDSAHKLRLKRNRDDLFLECSGYFWAFKNKIIRKFPIDVAEDSIVPAMFWIKGYKIKYAPKAEVYIGYPKNLIDYIKQKKRTIKSHEKIKKYVKKIPRMKTFTNELVGTIWVLFYASSLKEIFYSLFAIPIRAYLWILAYIHYFFNKEYQDAWERVESTKNF